MVVLGTLWVPSGTGPCCGADVPHPRNFILFAYILINAVFTAGAFPPCSPHLNGVALLRVWNHPHMPKCSSNHPFLQQRNNPDHLPFITV